LYHRETALSIQQSAILFTAMDAKDAKKEGTLNFWGPFATFATVAVKLLYLIAAAECYST
jgi:hypothetical protein